MDELTQLGRYQLLRVLGRGTAGVVYEGMDPALGRPVAVKAIELRQPDDAARFLTEAQAAARLNHPHIVTVHDFGQDNNIAYLVMERVDGEDLASYFADDQPFTLDFTLDDSVRIVCELLDALDYAHRHGIAHRDVKPANVLLSTQLRAKLTDFGMAGAPHAQTGRALAGTPAYMAPEQVLGQPAGPAADMFAAGVILYRFLAGAHPVSAEDLLALQRRIAFDAAPPPSAHNPAIGGALDAVLRRALAKQPDQRYPSAAAFRADLRRALAAQPDGIPP